MAKVDAALALAARGFKVFPVAAGAKAPPLIAAWPAVAGTSAQMIHAQWIGPCADANIGIHCAGLLVLDVDVKNGGDATFAVLEDMLPATLTTRTPSGGRHLFFRLPEGHPGVANSVGKLGPGLDVRSTNGYVVAPGSTVPAGDYTFVDATAPIAAAPDWLVQRCGVFTEREQREPVTVPDAPAEVLQRAAEWLARHPGAVAGEGGDAHTYATACKLRDFGVSQAQAVGLLAEWNERCDPPWTLAELEAKARNAYRYAQTGTAGTLAVSVDDFPTVEAPPEPPRKPRRGPQRLAALAGGVMDAAPYLVKGVLQRRSHAVLYGAPGQGKTFVALDIAYHVASGRDWQGHRVAKGLALYLAFEGVGGISRRGAALMRHYGNDDVPLYVEAADYNLREPAGRKALGDMMAGLPEKPALIVIDTLARAMKGGDENSAQDMGALNDAVGALIEATGACVLVIHHSGKNKASGARGSSALLGAIDTELEVADYAITPTKQRDLEMLDPMGFRLHPILLGTDEDGDDITSCVVMPVKVVPNSAGAKLRGNMRRAWDVLCEIRPQNDPVTEEEWKQACEEFLPKTRGALYDIRRRLVRAGLLQVNADCTIQRKLE